MLQMLMDMLSYRRPAGSGAEREFINRFIRAAGVHNQDERGNLWAMVGKSPNIMWSSHTDTVHHKDGRQFVGYLNDVLVVADRDSNCLGADDTTGVWIMLQMFKARVPGLYVFHRAEEKGGHGSAFFSENTLQKIPRLKALNLQACVAFDRHSKTHVITHQWGGRCASDRFARSFAAILDANGLPGYEPNNGGSFTDSANYTDYIGECTNISVGYKDQHRKDEHQYVGHALALVDAMCDADWSLLEYERRPGEVDPKDTMYSSYSSSYYGGRWDRGEHKWVYDLGDLTEVPPMGEGKGVTVVTAEKGDRVSRNAKTLKDIREQRRKDAEHAFFRLTTKDKEVPETRKNATKSQGAEEGKPESAILVIEKEEVAYTSAVNPEELDNIAAMVHGHGIDGSIDIFYGVRRYRRKRNGDWFEEDGDGAFTIPVLGYSVPLLPAPNKFD